MKVYLPIDPGPGEGVWAVGVKATPSTIGVVDDNLDPPFMQALVEGLRDRHPGTMVRLWIKPVGTAPAPESLIDEMAREVEIAVSGIGL